MLLIIEFPSESENEEYLDEFETAMEYYKKKKVQVSQTKVTDEQKVTKRLKFLFKYNKKLKFDFLFSDLLISHLDVSLENAHVFFFEEKKNPLKNVDPKEELRKKEQREKEERERLLKAEMESGETGDEGEASEGNMIGKDQGLVDFENDDDEDEKEQDNTVDENRNFSFYILEFS